LIAEDSQTQAVDLRRRLEAMGHEVVVTTDGQQAWNRLRDRPERLVILDWMMPVMNGLDLCRKIRAEIKSTYVYVILLTAKTHRHERLQGLSAGADDFLAKPIDHCELDIALKTAQRIIAAQEALVARARELERANQDLVRLAERDELTGLLNQRGFQESLATAVSQARYDHLPLSLIRLELDHRERLSEMLSLMTLQDLHLKVANLLRGESRDCDVSARVGEHGFALILPGLT
jgi:PleD family two-component response regulator